MNNSVRKALTKNVVDVAQSLVSLQVAGEVITDSLTILTEIGLGNILRVVVTAPTYVAFANEATTTVVASVATTPGLELAAGTHYILCTGKFIIMSADPTRKELIRT